MTVRSDLDRLGEQLGLPGAVRDVVQALEEHARQRYLRNGLAAPGYLWEMVDILAGAHRRAVAEVKATATPGVALRDGDCVPLSVAAQRLGVSRQRTMALIHGGTLRALQQPNRRWLVSEEDVMREAIQRGAA